MGLNEEKLFVEYPFATKFKWPFAWDSDQSEYSDYFRTVRDRRRILMADLILTQ